MAPSKSRETRSTAPTPSPAPTGRSRSSRSRSSKTTESDDTNPAPKGSALSRETVIAEESEAQEETDDTEGPETGAEEEVETDDVRVAGVGDGEDEVQEGDGADQIDGQDGLEEPDVKGKGKVKISMEDRMARLKDLRIRMNQSTAANRKDLVTDHQKQKVTAKELQRLEKQKKLAQTLRLKADAEANGEDMERTKAWEWSIEQNERWEKKMDEQKERSDTHFHNAEDDAFKRYNRNIRSTKADLLSYEKAKEAAMGLEPGTLVPSGSSSQSIATRGGSGSKGLTLSEDLYRGADTLAYGDSKPSEDAIDRLTAKINKDMGKGKRKKKEEEGEINYINDRNKVFNQKLARYFDKYTKEIRANFERGTAL